MAKNGGNKFIPTPVVQRSTFTGGSWEDPAGPLYRGVCLLARDTSAQLILCGQAGEEDERRSPTRVCTGFHISPQTRDTGNPGTHEICCAHEWCWHQRGRPHLGVEPQVNMAQLMSP